MRAETQVNRVIRQIEIVEIIFHGVTQGSRLQGRPWKRECSGSGVPRSFLQSQNRSSSVLRNLPIDEDHARLVDLEELVPAAGRGRGGLPTLS